MDTPYLLVIVQQLGVPNCKGCRPAQLVADAECIVMNDPLTTTKWVRWMFRDSGIEQLVTRFSSTLFGINTVSHVMGP